MREVTLGFVSLFPSAPHLLRLWTGKQGETLVARISCPHYPTLQGCCHDILDEVGRAGLSVTSRGYGSRGLTFALS
ncbi:MAG: hypothetical protein A2849_02905 [Candidatus Taylorbacteria bacterium RIFCSPHIGHO2_01_FULL_51_15]|uniref:Uncharacterized protein n=1 Tax=Candidatus Taylorbacteria bacterium RIFCSPHIGHO2_01_FULL_51_15 TaxID=1802304 RepID=A0A1G2M8U1_9BACT|nr:MAG: hypothetical protein A2849_02905 [Candidatus Taylorbacteria bacterium RIFCSPHIGHO2_01_FULL_51_15]